MKENYEYWEKRYVNGGDSGEGSRGELRDWKWEQIIDKIGGANDVIDVGCGDLEFMKNHHPAGYVGLDVSQTIIDRNRLLYPEWEFRNVGADEYIPGLRANVVFCHDLLFHILDDEVYGKILDNLMKYSYNYISVYSWDKNPIPWWNLKAKYHGSDKYQKYRNFDEDVERFEKCKFKLISKSKTHINKYGAMYIFRKQR